MTETHAPTDLGVGLAMGFGALAVLGALATGGTSYVYALQEDHTMQIFSGVALAVTFVFGGLAIAALHTFGE